MKVSQLLSDIISRLTLFSGTARLDAEVLTAYALGWQRTHLITRDNQQLTSEQLHRINALIERRIKGEPVAYIIGEREFWSLPITVNAHTLIPRPDTELLVETALTILIKNKNQRVLDLGTGSGAIVLALASECPSHQFVAVDTSLEALNIAEKNINKFQFSNIKLVHGNWFSAFNEEKFDLIVSNPPYIKTDDKHLNQGDVIYEPIEALTSGVDGLNDIRVISEQARDYLNGNGWLMMEHGWDQAEAVRKILSLHNYRSIKSMPDLSSIERITIAQL